MHAGWGLQLAACRWVGGCVLVALAALFLFLELFWTCVGSLGLAAATGRADRSRAAQFFFGDGSARCG